MTVYKLTHQIHIEYKLHTAEWVTETKMIGFFTSVEKANAAAEKLRLQPGFCDHPDDFVTEPYAVPEDTASVYYVQHSYYVIEERMDITAEIGVFGGESEAMAAASEYEGNVRSTKYPVGSHSWDEDFDIDNYLSVARYELDTADWQEGFVQY